jgi:hypothetical protein
MKNVFYWIFFNEKEFLLKYILFFKHFIDFSID